MMPLFAIRHKPSGFYLPQPNGFAGRGGSFTEPVDCSGTTINPRLFKSKIGARNALTQWLRGKHFPQYDYDDNGCRYIIGGDPLPQPHRKKEEMEIVEFALVPLSS